jgi:hypothetical protein
MSSSILNLRKINLTRSINRSNLLKPTSFIPLLNNVRPYASIAELDSATTAKVVPKDNIAPSAIIITGRKPTNALGFAERVAESAGGFKYEQWYQQQIDKKHDDKSEFLFLILQSIEGKKKLWQFVMGRGLLWTDSRYCWLRLPILQ